MTYYATISDRGQITIPLPVRQLLNLTKHNRVAIDIVEDKAALSCAKTIDELFADSHAYAREHMKKYGIKPIEDLDKALDDYYNSEEGQKELRRDAGLYDD
jgi:bifunctional DNA-binding transcriptional regulator/antitoxin component of YhaV-PrlF toxin-antitoxin module